MSSLHVEFWQFIFYSDEFLINSWSIYWNSRKFSQVTRPYFIWIYIHQTKTFKSFHGTSEYRAWNQCSNVRKKKWKKKTVKILWSKADLYLEQKACWTFNFFGNYMVVFFGARLHFQGTLFFLNSSTFYFCIARGHTDIL